MGFFSSLGKVAGQATGVLGAVGGLALNALAGARAARRNRRILADQRGLVNATADQQENASGLEDSGSQAALAEDRAQNADADANAKGVSAAMGASAANAVAMKSARNQASAQLKSNLAANDSANRRDVWKWRLGQLGNLANTEVGMNNQYAQQNATAAGEFSKTMAGIFGTPKNSTT